MGSTEEVTLGVDADVCPFQAALGPVALDMVRSMANPSAEELEYSNTVLQVAVLAIILTAPAGAAFISLLGPKLLEHDDDILSPGAL